MCTSRWNASSPRTIHPRLHLTAPITESGQASRMFAHWHHGHPYVLAVIATGCLLMYRGFKRNDWL